MGICCGGQAVAHHSIFLRYKSFFLNLKVVPNLTMLVMVVPCTVPMM